MKLRMLKDWNWQKAGSIAEVFDPLGEDWIQNGVAELFVEPREVVVERATADDPQAERAIMSEKRRIPKR